MALRISPHSQSAARGSCVVIHTRELVSRCMGNVDFAKRMLARFAEQLDADLTEIKQAASAHDWQLAAQISHRVRGAAANVAAHAIGKAAAELEVAACENDADTVWSRLPVLNAERTRLHQVMPAIDELVAPHS